MTRRFALLVGCENYRNPGFESLITPVDDIRALAHLLRDPEVGAYDQVILIPGDGRESTKHEVEQALDRFFLGRERDDLLFVYIACHGVLTANDELYFAMSDTARHLLPSTAIAAGWLADRVRECQAGAVVILLDCCHSGAYRSRAAFPDPDALISRDIKVSDRMLEQFGGEGRYVITASRATELAYEQTTWIDGRPPRSVFINAVIAGIETGAADRDRDGRITISELYDYVHDRLRAQSSPQLPLCDFRGVGQILVAWRRGRRPPRPPRPARPVESAADAATDPRTSTAGSSPTVRGPTVPAAITTAATTTDARIPGSVVPSSMVPDQREPGVRVRVVDVPLPPLHVDPQEFVIELWLHQVGDYVEQGAPLVELSHNHTVYRVEAPATGVLRAVTVTETERVDRTAIVGAVVIGGKTTIPNQRVRRRSSDHPIRTVLIRLPTLVRGVAGTVTAWWTRVGEYVAAGDTIGEASTDERTVNIIAPATGVIRAIVVAQGEAVLRHETVAILALP